MNAVYIHIPFCKKICSYCDFPKLYYNKDYIDKYLYSLKEEIRLNYNGELIDTIYIGGGTPSSLNLEEIHQLFDIINIFNKSNNIEITFECNIDVDIDKLLLLKHYNVNRLSIGIQTFNKKYLNYLNRDINIDITKKINDIKKIGFNNINVDLMYAYKNQTLDDLNNDLDKFINLNVEHISTYSLIIEPHTKLYIDRTKPINEDLDYKMYQLINKKLNNYIHYEVSNFSKIGYESKHNLKYWNNLNYYGFGMGASGYIDNIRYTNTFNINEYIKGNYIKDKEILDLNTTIENEFILGLRKIKGINKKEFKKKYNIDIISIDVVKKLIKEGKLIDDGSNIYIDYKYIYISNTILVTFIGVKYV